MSIKYRYPKDPYPEESVPNSDDECDCGECELGLQPRPETHEAEFKTPNTIDRVRIEVNKELKTFTPEQRKKAEAAIEGAYTLLETMLGQMPTVKEPIHLFDTEPYGEIPAKGERIPVITDEQQWEHGDYVSFNDNPPHLHGLAVEGLAQCGFCPYGTEAYHLKRCPKRDEARAARSIEINRQYQDAQERWYGTFGQVEEIEGYATDEKIMEPKTRYDQPDPIKNEYKPLWPLVIEDAPTFLYNENTALVARLREDMAERDDVGRARYGTPLQPFNGRNALADAYSEALDMLVYLKQQTIENPSDTDSLNLYHDAMDFAANLLRAVALSEGLKR